VSEAASDPVPPPRCDIEHSVAPSGREIDDAPGGSLAWWVRLGGCGLAGVVAGAANMLLGQTGSGLIHAGPQPEAALSATASAPQPSASLQVSSLTGPAATPALLRSAALATAASPAASAAPGLVAPAADALPPLPEAVAVGAQVAVVAPAVPLPLESLPPGGPRVASASTDGAPVPSVPFRPVLPSADALPPMPEPASSTVTALVTVAAPAAPPVPGTMPAVVRIGGLPMRVPARAPKPWVPDPDTVVPLVLARAEAVLPGAGVAELAGRYAAGPPAGEASGRPLHRPERGPGEAGAAGEAPAVGAAATRAVVHYHRARSAAFRDSLAASLRRAGFERVEWRAVGDAVVGDQSRYFHAGDRALSDRAVAALAGLGRPASVRDFTHYEPPARVGTVEVWLRD
jgi:hypothetical protein